MSFFDFGFKIMVLVDLSGSFIPMLARYHNRSLRGCQLLAITVSGASTYRLDLVSFSASWLGLRQTRARMLFPAGGEIHLCQALEQGGAPQIISIPFSKVYHLQRPAPNGQQACMVFPSLSCDFGFIRCLWRPTVIRACPES